MGECMNKLYFSLFLILFFTNFGCVPTPPPAPTHVFLMDVQSTNCSTIGGFLNYENDTIRVAYAFWAKNGIMGVFIYNKSDRPLYIDWKKCSFIIGETKQDYWRDITTMNSSSSSTESGSSESQTTSIAKSWFSIFLKSISGSSKSSTESVNNWAAQTFSSSTSIMTKPERITFIPPHTTICKADFSIVNNDIMVKPTMEKDTTLGDLSGYIVIGDTVRYIDCSSANVHLFLSPFSEENSPLFFRSFITYSTDEKFLSEAYIDSRFYISRITQMSIQTFNFKKRDDNRNIWAAHNSFYVFKTFNESP